MNTYIYKGLEPVFIPNHGLVYPGDEVTVARTITHPDFEEVTQEEAAPKKGKK